jgi:hypothetical protein
MRIISIIVAIIILITYFFPQLGLVGTLDCYERSIKQYITNSFYCANLIQLVFVLFAIYKLSILEDHYGSLKFGIILIALLFLSSFIHYLIPDPNCTTGFSNVLIGLIIFDKFFNSNWILDSTMIELLLLFIVLPWVSNRQGSFIGYLSGVIAGIVLGVGFNLFKINL